MIEDIVLKVERVHFLTIVNTLPDNAHLFASVLDEIKTSLYCQYNLLDSIRSLVISENEEDAKRVEEFLHHPTEVSLFLIRARIPNMECVFLFSIFSLLNKPLHSLQKYIIFYSNFSTP